MSKSIYVVGKMRGIPYFNFPEFDKARDRLKTLGFEVLSPADMDRAAGFDPWKWANDAGFHRDDIDWSVIPHDFDLQAAIERDNKAIEESDAIYVIHEGFAGSIGATNEVELGMRLGKTVVFDTMTNGQILRAIDPDALGVPETAAPTGTVETVCGAIEIRYTDPKTGGQKGEKLARFDLLPPDIVWELAEHYGKGARKYADRNMEKGYPWSKSYAACQRHLNAFWNGEDVDAETGSLHLIAAAWHCVTMAWFFRHNAGTDNRPNTGNEETKEMK